MASEPLTLAQLAGAADMSVDDVRLYRDRGLLPPARRSHGRRGDVGYHQEHIDRLRFIARAVIYGFSLDAVARLIDTSTLMTCGDILQIAQEEVRRLRNLLSTEAPSIAVMKELMDRCHGGSREDCPIYKALATDRARSRRSR
jgi:DNA-binding transcriptional MerR regulator